ncbi:unnamed protein product [Lymnaea stagnalis]|uniref:Peptidase S1 domain-containing protein n=1 Tax=Lymnaea stagnalis TaxID=6523 RepID=A0AAV2GYI8_LYMST
MQKRNRLIEELLYDLLYDTWSNWGACTRSCRQRRQRHCKQKSICVRSYIQEERRCQIPGSQCEHRFSLKPLGLSRGEMTSKTDQFVPTDDDEDEDIVHTLANNFGEKDGDGGHPDEKKQLGVSTTSRLGELLTTSTLTTAVGGRSKGRKGALSKDELELAQSECGIRPSQSLRSYRVVGGQEVQMNSWPWQVAILTKYQEQYCGGTLIAPRWVLTAAHCVKKNNRRRKLIVRVGEHDIQHFDPTQEDIRTEEEFPHPDFDYQTITNDIALIRLKHQPSAFTHPGYACLPRPEFKPQRDKPCTIVGWGKLKNTHIYGSDSLQEAKVPVVGHQKCRRVFDYNITSTQVCAGYKRGGTDSCAGDSGGPLLCTNPQDDKVKYYLYGVTSYGEGCGRKGKYGIYTKVSSYLDWIHRTIKDNS